MIVEEPRRYCGPIFGSIGGRVFISDFWHIPEIENILSNNEKVYLEGNWDYTLKKIDYAVSTKNATVRVDNILPVKRMGLAEYIKNLQKAMNELVDEATYFKGDVDLTDTTRYGDFDGKIIDIGKQNRPAIWFPSEKLYREYGKIYEKILKAKTKNRKIAYRNILIALKNYAILVNYRTAKLFLLEDILKQKDPIDYIVKSKQVVPDTPEIEEPKKQFVNGAFIISNEQMKLYSPSTIPKNAFLIFDDKIEPKYIQFTSKGVLITNGMLFARDPLEEVEYPWYAVQKKENGWDIFLNRIIYTYSDKIPYTYRQALAELGHWIHIEGNKIYSISTSEKENRRNVIFMNKEISVIDSDDFISVFSNHDNKLIKTFRKSDFERGKLYIGNKVIYAPKYLVVPDL